MAKTLTGLQKRREFLLRSCQKLLKISLRRPIAKLVSKSCQNMSKLAKSWLLCPVHVHCPVHILSLVHCIIWLKTQPRGQIFKPMDNLVCLGFDRSQSLFLFVPQDSLSQAGSTILVGDQGFSANTPTKPLRNNPVNIRQIRSLLGKKCSLPNLNCTKQTVSQPSPVEQDAPV